MFLSQQRQSVESFTDAALFSSPKEAKTFLEGEDWAVKRGYGVSEFEVTNWTRVV
jgi:hypothetical protein